ncbi:MAG: cysteine--tRNA ligase [Gammaproteobacteria bacterium]|nr:MAG: cysteine--tRNA ligase [Gammaproteobacteria bacterium]
MQIYNSLTRRKSEFIPIKPPTVNMYVCGMTVYDYCHIGHARVIVVFDMINRYFRHRGYKVNYVRNITDIDDKIIKRANENGESVNQLTARFIAAMHEDEAALKTLPPDKEPKATETVEQMIAHIEQLITLGHAYLSANGDVLYAITTFADYGKLANQKIDELQAGQRIEVDKDKKNPLDFVLWKSAKPGEPAWDSPWGKGRPGWHIECSAMSREVLGDHFDIHGGGLDLKFPHHECEIAQSEPICGGQHVNYWIHNGFVQVDAEKMSKSLGNFFTIRDVLAQFSGEVIRFFMLGTHYRSPLNYSDAGLQDSKNGLERLYTALRGIDTRLVSDKQLQADYPAFFAAMDDDFNSAKAISELFAIAKTLNKTTDDAKRRQLASELKSLGNILGLLQDNPETFLQGGQGDSQTADIEALIEQRNAARAQKDFATADTIRKQLHEMGVEYKNTLQK